MNSKRTKIIVNICMTIFLILSFIRWDGTGGAAYHFAVGTMCTIFFGIHVFIHRKWIVAVTKSCFQGKLKKSLWAKYIVDILLLAFWGVAIATGFLAIPPLFSSMDTASAIGQVHGITSRVGLGLIVIHIIQHIPQIKSYMGIKKHAKVEG